MRTGSGHAQLGRSGVVAILAAPVPEPGTWALMDAGLAAMRRMARRVRRQGASIPLAFSTSRA